MLFSTNAPFAVHRTLYGSSTLTSLQQALHELPIGGQAHPWLNEEALPEAQPGDPQRKVS